MRLADHLTEISRYKNRKISKATMVQDQREESREVTHIVREEILITTRKILEKIIRDSMLENSNLNIIYSTVSNLIIMQL